MIMGEILLFVLTTGGITAFARGRGGKPWLWGYAKPDGMWSCKNCSYLNKQYAVVCEACRQPYASKALPFS
jgi:hypothetical protein